MKKSTIYDSNLQIIDQDQSPSLKVQLTKMHKRGQNLPEEWSYKYKIHNKEEIKSLCDEFGYPYPSNI